MALTVVFADDNYLVREGIAALLTEIDDVELVDTVADPASLLKAVAEHQPDAVLTDIRIPRRSPPKASVQPNRFDSTI